MPGVKKRPSAALRPKTTAAKRVSEVRVKPATRSVLVQTTAPGEEAVVETIADELHADDEGADERETPATAAVTKKPAAAVDKNSWSMRKKPAAAVEESSSFDEAEALYCPLDTPPSSPSDLDINSDAFKTFANLDPYCGALPSAANTALVFFGIRGRAAKRARGGRTHRAATWRCTAELAVFLTRAIMRPSEGGFL